MTAELTRREAKPKTVGRDVQHTTLLIVATFAGSFIIALYVLAVCTLNQQHKDSNSLDRAAYIAARSLSEITASHPSLGKVGLIDWAPPQEISYAEKKKQLRINGLNSLYATLRVDALIAQQLKNQSLINLNVHDFKIAKQLEGELTRRMFAAVEQVPDQDPGIAEPQQAARQLITAEGDGQDDGETNSANNDSILQQVSQLLSDDIKGRGTNLVDVRITLGCVEPGKLSTQTYAPLSERDKEYVKDGMYRSGIPIAMPDGKTIIFHGQPHSTRIIDSSWFNSAIKGSAPSAVRVEGIYERIKEGGQKEKFVKSACAAVGGAPAYPRASAFVVNFPHGKPDQFENLSAILNFKHWESQGEWQQVVGTEVPGKGSLAPPMEAISGGLTPGDALAHALYDWLKQMGAAHRFHAAMAHGDAPALLRGNTSGVRLLTFPWESGGGFRNTPPVRYVVSRSRISVHARPPSVPETDGRQPVRNRRPDLSRRNRTRPAYGGGVRPGGPLLHPPLQGG